MVRVCKVGKLLVAMHIFVCVLRHLNMGIATHSTDYLALQGFEHFLGALLAVELELLGIRVFVQARVHRLVLLPTLDHDHQIMLLGALRELLRDRTAFRDRDVVQLLTQFLVGKKEEPVSGQNARSIGRRCCQRANVRARPGCSSSDATSGSSPSRSPCPLAAPLLHLGSSARSLALLLDGIEVVGHVGSLAFVGEFLCHHPPSKRSTKLGSGPDPCGPRHAPPK